MCKAKFYNFFSILVPKIQELTGDFKIDTDDDVDEKVTIVKSPTADGNSVNLFDCAEASELMKQTLDGFLVILTNDGDITYVSDNITEYLGIAKVLFLCLPCIFYRYKKWSS